MVRSKMMSVILVTMLLITLLAVSGNSQTTGGVQVGEPLHLWFKRSPTQDMTTLVYYEPSTSDEVVKDTRYRHMIGPGWNETSTLEVYFPTAVESNFLQFEYNSSLKGNYSFTISAITPRNASDITFRLKVTIDLDRMNEQNGKYDESIVFTIVGLADSDRRTYKGNISVPEDLVDRFDGKKGGRIRITLERDDELDTNLVLYCGYAGELSFFNLPYSKYRYIPPDPGNGREFPIVWVLVIGFFFIIALVFIIFLFKGKEGFKKEEPKGRKGRRDRRR